MHNAPAVSYPVGRSPFALAAMTLAWLAGAVGIALWAVQAQVASASVVAASAVLAACGLIALRSWLRSPRGTIAWDGLCWTWTIASEAQSGTPEVALDAQRVLLLRCNGGRRAQWLWLERGAQPARWNDLRRAVYSRASPP
jgi:toxin CptA